MRSDSSHSLTRKLPVKAEIRKLIGKQAGDTVTVCLHERIGGLSR